MAAAREAGSTFLQVGEQSLGFTQFRLCSSVTSDSVSRKRGDESKAAGGLVRLYFHRQN